MTLRETINMACLLVGAQKECWCTVALWLFLPLQSPSSPRSPSTQSSRRVQCSSMRICAPFLSTSAGSFVVNQCGFAVFFKLTNAMLVASVPPFLLVVCLFPRKEGFFVLHVRCGMRSFEQSGKALQLFLRLW